MKLQIICDKCGKIATLEPYQVDNQIYLNQLEGFTIIDIDIEKNGDLDEISDIDDIETTVNCIRICCDNCGEYLNILGIQ